MHYDGLGLSLTYGSSKRRVLVEADLGCDVRFVSEGRSPRSAILSGGSGPGRPPTFPRAVLRAFRRVVARAAITADSDPPSG